MSIIDVNVNAKINDQYEGEDIVKNVNRQKFSILCVTQGIDINLISANKNSV